MLLAVPDRLDLALGVVLHLVAGARGEGVDDLTISERVTVPAEVGLQILGRLGHPGADDEPQIRLVEVFQVAAGQHPGVGDDDHVGQPVPLGELLDDWDDRQRLGLVALEAPDLEREAPPVDQQAHDDLWIDTAFLGVADLAQRVFVLGLEVERGHVVEHQRHVTSGQRTVEAGRRDLPSVVALLGSLQGTEHRAQRG